MAHNNIQYSEKYYDDVFEYRHVVLPPEIAQHLPKNRLLSEVKFGMQSFPQQSDLGHANVLQPSVIYRMNGEA
eukprot:gene5042-5284_t